ncbi:Uncharacterised protein [Vibrio cholerae]|nr:Uncharacterised protein [Vibrio cholerae]CSB66740.1 Uncharacterised protein [Vibrio cholerae]CSC73536.1 Uncharacterised protein [Vibrio cholerae]CSI48603.1 Uncharacterised protein [Vibrio cholerae]
MAIVTIEIRFTLMDKQQLITIGIARQRWHSLL